MAALNQAKIIKALEKLTVEATPSNFFFGFLKAFGFANSTIKFLEKNDKSRNIALTDGDYGLAKQIYFRPVAQGADINGVLDELIDCQSLQQHKVRFFITTDFKTIAAYDKRVDDRVEFEWEDLKTNFDFFLPLTGQYEKPVAYSSHPADVKACEKMGRLYDIIKVLNHYDDSNLHSLNVFLTRLLFCFFAEDTGIFRIKSQMTDALASMTAKDGHDLPEFFDQLFAVLDLPDNSVERKNFPATLQAFPYVNGGLFREQIEVPVLNAKARNILLDCGRLVWSEISPVIFGSMFQSVMNPEERHEIGAHYTSEKNIFKVIGPLFLDGLKEEFERICSLKNGSDRKKKLEAFQKKLATLRFLDPACGCGNFLIVAYREIKMLELQVAKELYANKPGTLSIDLSLEENISQVSIDQFYGIELLEFPVEVARVSMWLMEHVVNLRFGEQFGAVFPSIPLKKTPQIVCANALTTDWSTVIDPTELDYIMGNPPFSGALTMTTEQKKEILTVCNEVDKAKSLDYVVGWYFKACHFAEMNKKIEVGFVSTNSICQGEQVAPIWGTLLDKGVFINFAHQTFQWKNDAKKNAGVYCVIVGWGFRERLQKAIFHYQTVNSEPMKTLVRSINGYLMEGNPHIFVNARSKVLSSPLNLVYGNMPRDGGCLIVEAHQYDEILLKAPFLDKYLKKLIGSKELLHNLRRYCFWLTSISLSDSMELPIVGERVRECSAFRAKSKAASTRKMAETAHLFAQRTQPEGISAIVIPRVSSERREYIPMSFIDGDTIVTDLCHIVPHGGLYDFGILESRMHMTWMRTVCGRLESRYRYSRDLCYNTFPWPDATEPQKKVIENLANNVLMIREFYPDMTLADLYDPDKMPEDLRKAHQELDAAVDKLYRRKPFDNDEQRLKHLFGRYEKLVKGEDSSTLYHEE